MDCQSFLARRHSVAPPQYARSLALIEKTFSYEWNCCVRNFVSFINKNEFVSVAYQFALCTITIAEQIWIFQNGFLVFFFWENENRPKWNFRKLSFHRPRLSHKIKATSKHSWLIAFLQDIKNERNIKNAALPFNTEPCHKRTNTQNIAHLSNRKQFPCFQALQARVFYIRIILCRRWKP